MTKFSICGRFERLSRLFFRIIPNKSLVKKISAFLYIDADPRILLVLSYFVNYASYRASKRDVGLFEIQMT